MQALLGGFPGNPEFLKCPVFPGSNLEYYPDVQFFLDFSHVPLFSESHVFPDQWIFWNVNPRVKLHNTHLAVGR